MFNNIDKTKCWEKEKETVSASELISNIIQYKYFQGKCTKNLDFFKLYTDGIYNFFKEIIHEHPLAIRIEMSRVIFNKSEVRQEKNFA